MAVSLSYYPDNRYDKQKIYDELQATYAIEGLDPNYFEYLDTKTFVGFEKAEFEELQAIVRSVNGIFRKAYSWYWDDLARNLPEFSRIHEYFRKEFPYDEYFIARYDVLIDVHGEYKFLETNANTPGLITESNRPSAMFLPEGWDNQAGGLIEYVRDFWKGKMETLSGGDLAKIKLGILLPHSYENEDYLVGRDYYDILSSVIPEENLVIGDIYETNVVDGSVTLKGQRIDAILSYFPFEFFLTDIDFTLPFLEAVADGNCLLVNPLESMAFQDKLMFAVIWENLEKYSAEEQAAIHRHIPFTTREFQESTEYLAKWRFGRYGREIYWDRFYTNLDHVDKFIFQKKVEPRKENEQGDFLVLGAFSDLRESISFIARKQEHRTTDDTYNLTTLAYARGNINV
jgi:glutathionylspermidine synthase